MSEFHGGFFVRSRDPRMQEPIRRALAARLGKMRIDLERHKITFATRAGAPVVHVAVRGALADGKDYASFHREHAALGAEVARAANAVVWAYAYENQVGTESVARFEPDGSRGPAVFAEWDEFAEERGVDVDEPGAMVRLMSALPLGVLAKELGVSRALLEVDLAYDTPSVSVPLAGEADPEALARYLSGPLLEMPIDAAPEEGRTQALYFPPAMAREAQALAQRLRISTGRVFTAAWELAKPEMVPSTPGFEGAPPMAAFPRRDIAELRVPAEAPPLADPSSDDKVKLSLALPEAMLEEVAAWASHQDRSLSWCVQRAYKVARARLHAAQRS